MVQSNKMKLSLTNLDIIVIIIFIFIIIIIIVRFFTSNSTISTINRIFSFISIDNIVVVIIISIIISVSDNIIMILLWCYYQFFASVVLFYSFFYLNSIHYVYLKWFFSIKASSWYICSIFKMHDNFFQYILIRKFIAIKDDWTKYRHC